MTIENVVISGAGRCGTTMVMRMLHAGGIPVFAHNAYGYEFDHSINLIQALDQGRGAVFKVLSPPLGTPLMPTVGLRHCRVIWMHRQAREQAKSHAKIMAGIFRHATTRPNLDRLAASLLRDNTRMPDEMRSCGAEVLELWFEAILRDPAEAARQITRFLPPLWIVSDMRAMAAAVFKRGSACYDGLFEEKILASPIPPAPLHGAAAIV